MTPFLLAGGDRSWRMVRIPVLTRPTWKPLPYSGTCPFCLKAWTGIARSQVVCSKACGRLMQLARRERSTHSRAVRNADAAGKLVGHG